MKDIHTKSKAIAEKLSNVWRDLMNAGELAAANAEIARLRKEHKAMSKGAQINALVAKSLTGKLAKARKDSERLDWLLSQDPPAEVILDYAFDPAWDKTILLDSRTSIDAAMSEASECECPVEGHMTGCPNDPLNKIDAAMDGKLSLGGSASLKDAIARLSAKLQAAYNRIEQLETKLAEAAQRNLHLIHDFATLKDELIEVRKERDEARKDSARWKE